MSTGASLSRAQLSGKDVVSTGSFVVQYGQCLKIIPFAEDEYSILVDINLTEIENRVYAKFNDVAPYQAVIVLDFPYPRVTATLANKKPIVIAKSADSKVGYYVNICVNLLGERESYTAAISYTIFAEEIV